MAPIRCAFVIGLLFVSSFILQSPSRAQWQPFADDAGPRSSPAPRRSADRSDRTLPPLSQYVLISRATDEALGRAIGRYEQLLAAGGWDRIPEGRSMKFGDSDNRVVALRRRLQATGELGRDGRSNRRGFDRDVERAVVSFQKRHGLTPSGKVNRFTLRALNVTAAQRLHQLRLNRKRLRQILTRTKGKTYILVNIPGYELQAVSRGRLQLSSRVVSGKPTTRTPEVTTSVRAVNFLPYWHVPQSIAHRALIPAIKKDPNYLAREHIRVYASWGGAEVNPAQVNWYAPQGKRYVFRQDPGPFNALGLIRLDMPNRYIVYMHDTPLKKLFKYHLRPYSAGCVRVEQVQQLAQWLLEKDGAGGPGTVSRTLQAGQAQTIKLRRPIPVHFVYLSAWATSDGQAQFRVDIYDMDAVKSGRAARSKWESGSRKVAP